MQGGLVKTDGLGWSVVWGVQVDLDVWESEVCVSKTGPRFDLG
jgi:hypothetical protein